MLIELNEDEFGSFFLSHFLWWVIIFVAIFFFYRRVYCCYCVWMCKFFCSSFHYYYYLFVFSVSSLFCRFCCHVHENKKETNPHSNVLTIMTFGNLDCKQFSNISHSTFVWKCFSLLTCLGESVYTHCTKSKHRQPTYIHSYQSLDIKRELNKNEKEEATWVILLLFFSTRNLPCNQYSLRFIYICKKITFLLMMIWIFIIHLSNP